ncbi:hypothetical protein ACFQT0_16010 [Hymenobacter humi]|uniref:Uncharacterized protein n=1 Tax=Hymenobacter humi TaxID=1411620 RepID=A0ABW2U8H1_9BACT
MPASPVLGAALNLQAEFNVSPGPRDFVGNPTPELSATGNIGALESRAAAPLPVVLSRYTAEQQGTAAVLRWATASEKNNAFFAIESSHDGRAFTELSQVSGKGNSSQAQTYQYTDPNLARYAVNTVYYRLRQVDTDGKASYSPVATLSGDWAESVEFGALQVALTRRWLALLSWCRAHAAPVFSSSIWVGSGSQCAGAGRWHGCAVGGGAQLRCLCGALRHAELAPGRDELTTQPLELQ